MKITANLLAIFFAFFIISAKVTASESYAECNLCIEINRELTAKSWATKSMTAQSPPERVVIIDLANREASTYLVSLSYIPGPPGYPAILASNTSLVTTSTYVKEQLVSVDNAVADFARASQKDEVPKTVIPDAWQFVNCAACENDLSDYLNSQLIFQLETMTQSMQIVADIFGISTTGIPDIFQVSLAGGGTVEFSAKLFNDPVKLKITVIKVIDKDNNTVPFQDKQLKNLILKLSDLNSARNVNTYIMNFQFYVPLRTGYVTVMNCLPGNEDPCKSL